MIQPFDDLPEIQLKAHAQAKRLKLAVSTQGIRLTHPPKTTQSLIDRFLKQSYPWLLETWRKQQIQLNQQHPQDLALPTVLNLAYHLQPYHIIYQDQQKKFICHEAEHIVYISNHAPEKYLTQFVIAQAKQILPQQLMQFANQHQCTVSQVRLAAPKTRWGSCSSRQEIMLHAGLVLMPQAYADYVLLHELAHTKVMNHQPEFWQVLDSFLPRAKKIQASVKKYRLPHWWQPK